MHINLTDLLGMIPVKVESADPLAIELATNINSAFKIFGYFPKIVCRSNDNSFPIGRLNEYYRKEYAKDTVELLMWEEAQTTKLFTGNYNPKTKKFLAEQWSHVNAYSR